MKNKDNFIKRNSSFCVQELSNQVGSSWLKVSDDPIPDASQAVKQYTFTCRPSIPSVWISYGITDGPSKIKFNNVTESDQGPIRYFCSANS